MEAAGSGAGVHPEASDLLQLPAGPPPPEAPGQNHSQFYPDENEGFDRQGGRSETDDDRKCWQQGRPGLGSGPTPHPPHTLTAPL